MEKLKKILDSKFMIGLKIISSIVYSALIGYIAWVFVSPMGASTVPTHLQSQMYFFDYVFLFVGVVWFIWVIYSICVAIQKYINKKDNKT